MFEFGNPFEESRLPRVFPLRLVLFHRREAFSKPISNCATICQRTFRNNSVNIHLSFEHFRLDPSLNIELLANIYKSRGTDRRIVKASIQPSNEYGPTNIE